MSDKESFMDEAYLREPNHERGTPAAQWRAAGEPDPHGNRYNCKRDELTLGELTDDALANAVFLHGNENPNISAVMRGEALMPISYLTAAKDRIRWLSRQLCKLQEACKELEGANALNKNALRLAREENERLRKYAGDREFFNDAYKSSIDATKETK